MPGMRNRPQDNQTWRPYLSEFRLCPAAPGLSGDSAPNIGCLDVGGLRTVAGNET